MRNATINETSPKSDVLGALTGIFEEVRNTSGKWNYTKTPFFLAVYGTIDAGESVLPFKFGDNVVANIAYYDGTSENKPIKINDSVLTMEKGGVVSIIAFGRAADVRPII